MEDSASAVNPARATRTSIEVASYPRHSRVRSESSSSGARGRAPSPTRFRRRNVHAQRAGELFENILHSLHDLGAVADELMATAGDRIANGARHGEHLAPLVEGLACGDQRPASKRCLHHQHPPAQPTDDAVAPGEVGTQRRSADGELRNHRAARGHRPRQTLRGQGDRCGRVPLAHTATVGAGEQSAPRWADPSMPSARPLTIPTPLSAELPCEVVSDLLPGCARVAAAHYGHHGPAQALHVALHEEHRRRIGKFREEPRDNRGAPATAGSAGVRPAMSRSDSHSALDRDTEGPGGRRALGQAQVLRIRADRLAGVPPRGTARAARAPGRRPGEKRRKSD